MIQLLITLALALPTVNGQRVDYGTYEAPYWLGFSIPPFQAMDIKAVQDGAVLFQIQHGTEFNLAYIDNPAAITFYDHGVQIGQIVPEPTTLLLLLPGVLLRRRK